LTGLTVDWTGISSYSLLVVRSAILLMLVGLHRSGNSWTLSYLVRTSTRLNRLYEWIFAKRGAYFL